MASYTLRVGTGGIGNDPVLSVRHSVQIYAATVAGAVDQARQKIEKDIVFYSADRIVLTASDGSVIWHRPTGDTFLDSRRENAESFK